MLPLFLVLLAVLFVSAGGYALRARRSMRSSFLLGSLGVVSTSWLVSHRAEQP